MTLTVAPSPSPLPDPSPSKKMSKLGIIVGPVAAVVAVLFLAGVYFLRRRRSRARIGSASLEGGPAIRQSDVHIEEKFKTTLHEIVGSAGGEVGPHNQDGADRHYVPRKGVADQGRKNENNANFQHMDGRGDGETEEEWLERMMRESNERMGKLDSMKRRLDERRKAEAQLDGSDGSSRPW